MAAPQHTASGVRSLVERSDTPTAHAHHRPPSAAPARGHSRTAVLLAACVGFFVIVLDTTVVNVALPSIGADLQAGIAGLQWVIDGYVVVFAALLLSTGALSDRVGASSAFRMGLLVFGTASLVCGAAPSLLVLMVARILQGAAGAMVLPSSLALVRQAFGDSGERARAIAIWTAGGGAAVAAGPLLVGILTSALDWRTIFFINLPVGLVGATAVTCRRQKEKPGRKRKPTPPPPLGSVRYDTIATFRRTKELSV